MQKKILIFVHTEYHLLLAINQILAIFKNPGLYDIELLIRRGSGKRLTQEPDFSGLPVTAKYFNEDVTINKNLSQAAQTAIQELLDSKPDVFIFFQEMDPLMVILAGHFAKKGTEVCLYQDGLKPYNHLKYHSLGLLKHFHRQNLWMKKNGFPVESWLSPIWAKKYAHLKSIKKVYLTFPESYKNWNSKSLEKIEMVAISELNRALKKVFRWDEKMLPERENLIFYMSQPMHDDGVSETKFLKELSEKFPSNKIYIKLHPLTNEVKIQQYQKFANLEIIRSQIPAELFIMNLEKSLVLSLNSTSMFLNNPENKFYYLYKILQKDIKRLMRYEIKNNPAPHITVVEKLDDITF
jgi:hypothetical protein